MYILSSLILYVFTVSNLKTDFSWMCSKKGKYFTFSKSYPDCLLSPDKYFILFQNWIAPSVSWALLQKLYFYEILLNISY